MFNKCTKLRGLAASPLTGPDAMRGGRPDCGRLPAHGSKRGCRTRRGNSRSSAPTANKNALRAMLRPRRRLSLWCAFNCAGGGLRLSLPPVPSLNLLRGAKASPNPRVVSRAWGKPPCLSRTGLRTPRKITTTNLQCMFLVVICTPPSAHWITLFARIRTD